jgi:signal transduction histidine kinase
VKADVDVSCSSGRIVVRVCDNGPGLELPLEYGVGLSNMRDRLAYLYGSDATLTVENNDQGGATVELSFPVVGAVREETGLVKRNLLRQEARVVEQARH